MVNLILVSLLLIGFESLIPIELSEVFFFSYCGDISRFDQSYVVFSRAIR